MSVILWIFRFVGLLVFTGLSLVALFFSIEVYRLGSNASSQAPHPVAADQRYVAEPPGRHPEPLPYVPDTRWFSVPHVQAQCEAAAGQQAGFAPPAWIDKWVVWIDRDGTFVIHRDARYLNYYNQWIRATVSCDYNRTTESVKIDVKSHTSIR